MGIDRTRDRLAARARLAAPDRVAGRDRVGGAPVRSPVAVPARAVPTARTRRAIE